MGERLFLPDDGMSRCLPLKCCKMSLREAAARGVATHSMLPQVEGNGRNNTRVLVQGSTPSPGLANQTKAL